MQGRCCSWQADEFSDGNDSSKSKPCLSYPCSAKLAILENMINYLSWEFLVETREDSVEHLQAYEQ
jgi:hypothetical protein